MHEDAGKSVPFTLNGKPLVAEPGETVLNVAKREGVHIPTLCHHEAVTDYGACRICVVEVSWGKRSKLVTSCLYQPYENDRVETDNDRVRRTRRTLLEMLLARCPSVQEIRDLAEEYGANVTRFPTDETKKDERCILCGLCVRVCDEVIGKYAIGYASRGMDRTVASPFRRQSEDCIGCGACAFVCPTGALYCEEDGQRVRRGLSVLEMATCRVCERPFAPAKLVATVQQRLKLTEEAAMTCPSCRSRRLMGAVGKALGNNRPYDGMTRRMIAISSTAPGLENVECE